MCLLLRHARPSEESEEHEACGVHRGEEYAREEDEPQQPVALVVEGRGKDLVLGKEAREGREPRQPHRPHQEGDGSDEHTRGDAAHLAQVLLAVEAMDDAARAQEEERLEEGVGDEVEDAGGVRAHPYAHEHVAELADGRVGEHTLDVRLGHPDGGREEGGEAAHATISRERGAISNSLWQRATMYTPAVTMVAAWISAETGVGPSMASGSQVKSGSWADLPQAPGKRRGGVAR